MKTGTKSLLFGVHHWLWHPFTVALAWKELYGWPSWRETVCIFVHDWGYWESEHMEDETGQSHPVRGADRVYYKYGDPELYKLVLFHSRHLARNHGATPSRLCWADKLSMRYDPRWFYLLRSRLSGELKEYRQVSAASGFCPLSLSDKAWYNLMRAYMIDMGTNQQSGEKYMGGNIWKT